MYFIIMINLSIFFFLIRLSGISPFACEDEDETMASVTALDFRFEPRAFADTTEEAKKFIKGLIVRIPEYVHDIIIFCILCFFSATMHMPVQGSVI